MKTIWVVQYNDGTADVFDEDQGPPSWPYVDAFEAKERIAELADCLVKSGKIIKNQSNRIVELEYSLKCDKCSNNQKLQYYEKTKN